MGGGCGAPLLAGLCAAPGSPGAVSVAAPLMPGAGVALVAVVAGKLEVVGSVTSGGIMSLESCACDGIGVNPSKTVKHVSVRYFVVRNVMDNPERPSPLYG